MGDALEIKLNEVVKKALQAMCNYELTYDEASYVVRELESAIRAFKLDLTPGSVEQLFNSSK